MSDPTEPPDDADRHRCEHLDCPHEGMACFLGGPEPDGYWCAEHAEIEGFCWACGNYSAGIEGFEFSKPRGLCDNCRTDPDIIGWQGEDEDDDLDYLFLEDAPC